MSDRRDLPGPRPKRPGRYLIWIAASLVCLCASVAASEQTKPEIFPSAGAISVRRQTKTGWGSVQVDQTMLRRPVNFLLRGFCKYDPDSRHWQQVPWHLLGLPTRIDPEKPKPGPNYPRVLVSLPEEIALFTVYWTEAEAELSGRGPYTPVWREQIVTSGPVLCEDLSMGKAPEGMIAACVPFKESAEARFVPRPDEECGMILPESLKKTYDQLTAALASGKRAEIEKFCMPGKIKITSTPRPEKTREYGQDINLPFLKNGFAKEILNSAGISPTEFLIRTGTTALWFEKTADGKWKLTKYLDKPIE
jgi:hypothetical protein